jgi:non-ribosomal peptide synthetase component E (peptide arylation enzyme)
MMDDYLARGYWDMVSIADILEQNALNFPDKKAIVDSESRLTWSQLNRLVNRIALGLLELGIKRDQAILVQLPSSAIAVMLCLAFQKAGILGCFTPMTFRHNEMEHVMKTLKAVGIVTSGRWRNFNYFSMAKEIAPNLPELKYLFVVDEDVPEGAISIKQIIDEPIDKRYPQTYLRGFNYGALEVSVIVLSSGSTGMPKCIEQVGAACKAGGWGVIERAGLVREDIFGIIAPFSGGPGFQSWWASFQLAAKVCLLEHFSPEATLDLIQKERVSFLSAIPTQIIRILRETDLSKYDLSSLRVIRTGGAAFNASLAAETEERMGCKVVIAGGSQETYTFAHTSVDDPPDVRLETLGKPFPKTELRIVDDMGREVSNGEVGELWVRGAATSSGYYQDIEATITAWGEVGENGWFRTGDLAKFDAQGNLLLVGRKKDMILRGGQNIYPQEVENILLHHPKLQEVAIIGIPDMVMGERACACIVPKSGQELTLKEATDFLKDKGVAIHKLPERLEVIEKIPTVSDVQKIDRKILRKIIIEKLKTEGKI